MDLSKLEKQLDKANDGEWTTVKGTDFQIFVRPMDNPDYLKIRQRILKKLNIKKLTDVMDREVTLESVAEGIATDWRNAKENGKEVPYSSKRMHKYLMNYAVIREHVLEKANDQLERNPFEEEAKN